MASEDALNDNWSETIPILDVPASFEEAGRDKGTYVYTA